MRCTSVAAVLTLLAVPAWALELGVSGRKLIVLDKLAAASKAKIVFVSADQTAGITKGAGTDVADIEVAFEYRYGNGGAAGMFVVPAGASAGGAAPGWKVNRATVAKYVNKTAPGGPTGVKVAAIKPGKLLKLVAKSTGDTPIDILGAGAPDAAGVTTVFTVRNGDDTIRHCTTFSAAAGSSVVYKPIAGDTGAKLVMKNGVPASCPALPLDHYAVYVLGTAGGSGPVLPVEDLFGQTTPDLGFGNYVFAPADVDGAGVLDAVTHELCWSIPAAPFGAAVTVTDRFGVHDLQLGAPNTLCLPSEKDPGPTPLPLEVDEFQCYPVLAPAPPPLTVVTSSDSFEPLAALVADDPLWFCTPADTSGAGLLNPNGHLACYETQPAFGSGAGGNFTFRNALGTFSKFVVGGRGVCFPATLTASTTTCPHDKCERGGSLDPSCDPCVADVCLANPSCCTGGAWDEACVNAVRTICGEPCPATCGACDADPTRTVFVGDPSFVTGCTDFGDEASCEQAWQCGFQAGPASCFWNGSTCQACEPNFEGSSSCLNTCLGGPASCEGDPSRTLFAGWRNTDGCGRFDGDQTSCESAFEFTDMRVPTTCRWSAGTSECLPCAPFEHAGGTCSNTCPVCPEDPSRTTYIFDDFGACSAKSDQPSCEESFFVLDDTGLPTACYWDGFDCRDCGPSEELNGFCDNTCLAEPCATAVTIPAEGGTFDGTTAGGVYRLGATSDGDETPSVLYAWTPTTSGQSVIATCGGLTDFDTAIHVREGGCTTGPFLPSGHDECGTAANHGEQVGSLVSPVVTAGQTYYLIVTGADGAAGNYTLTVRPPVP
jgi:hypothetical protein